MVAWLPKLLATTKRYATDVSFFSAMTMNLDMNTSLMISRMEIHSRPSDWSQKRMSWARARTHVGKLLFRKFGIGIDTLIG